jgi:hypothetical protein
MFGTISGVEGKGHKEKATKYCYLFSSQANFVKYFLSFGSIQLL